MKNLFLLLALVPFLTGAGPIYWQGQDAAWMNSGQMIAPDGSLSAPSYSFGDSGSGMYYASSGPAFAVNGVLPLFLRTNKVEANVPIHVPVGSVSDPSVQASTGTSQGMYFPASGEIAFSNGTISLFHITAAKLVSETVHEFQDGTAALPSITNEGDPNTGVYFPAADEVGLATAGVLRLHLFSDGAARYLTASNKVFRISDNITDSTEKRMRLGVDHYTSQTEEPFGVIHAQSNGTVNVLGLGGGTGSMNAATEVSIYTAATDTTTTGTKRVTVDSSGNVVFTGTIDPHEIIGTTTNDDASTGEVGEFVDMNLVSDTASTCSGYKNLGSISIGPGDWDVYGSVAMNSGGTGVTRVICGASSSSVSFAPNNVGGLHSFSQTSGSIAAFTTMNCGMQRRSVSIATTIYLLGYSDCSTTFDYDTRSYLYARRVR